MNTIKTTLTFTTFSTLLFIAGCSTPTLDPLTPKQHPEKYTLQILRIETPIDERSTEPILDENNERATEPSCVYSAPQITDLFTTNALQSVSGPCIETRLSHPDVTMTEFPTVYANIGETAINDQTEPTSFPSIYTPEIDTNGDISVVYGN
ncbi:MAG: hypothetical protein OEL75_02435 [Kiritimatiellaceae bacterium]|nr:hypothetical protein [Kiritimatiellaceae bacterium]